MKRRPFAKRRLSVQPLEARRVLAASLGWDGPGLGSAELTYHVANSPDSLTQEETEAAIATAFDAWASAADITFTPTDQSGLQDSIDITFTSIDGVGGTLAQAYFPDDVNPARIAGDIEFDIADAWEVGNSLAGQAFDLVYVAVHEIGHSLGLDHTDAVDSVLAPFVTANQFFTTLSDADAAAVQEVYAAADTVVDDDPPVSEEPVDETPIDETPVEDDPADETPTDETPSDELPSDDDDDHDHDVDDDDTLPDSEDDPFPRRRWRRGGNWHRWGGRLESTAPEYNYVNPTDVNGDNATTAVDALMIINQLNLGTSTTDNEDIDGLCDANGDGVITALDALTVINALNSETEQNAAVAESVDVLDDTLDTEETNPLETEEELVDEDVADEEDMLIDEEEPVDDPTDVIDDETADESEEESTEENTEEDTDEMIDDGGLVDETEDTTDNGDTSEEEESDEEESEEESGEDEVDDETDNEETGDEETSDDETVGDTEDESDEEEEETDEDTDVEDCHDGVGHHSRRFGVVNVGLFRGDAESLITRFDTDEDGSLSEEEVPERVWEKLSELGVDADADGLVTLTEVETAIATARQDAFDSKDSDSDGVLTEDEVSERFWGKISDADTDADDAVSFDELDAFFAERSAQREEFAGESFGHRHRTTDEVFASIGRGVNALRASTQRASTQRFGRRR
ncbi:matrixin family metalloprotease [Rhodopirellula sallentina]|nr:matrixin family metalloprotease [Rhodopirellula sallentina]